MRTGGVRYGIELDTLSYILHHIVGKVCHKMNACVFNMVLRTKSVTKKEINKCIAEIYDPGGIRTRAAWLISQYHNH